MDEALTPAFGDTDLGARILKVNHAGENGAVHIYLAQAAVARWTAPSFGPNCSAAAGHVAAAMDCVHWVVLRWVW